MTEQKTHSKIGASSMHRWKECPGSVKLCETMPRVETEYAKEGTYAHEVAAALLENKQIIDLKLDDEGFAAVKTYVDYVNEKRQIADHVFIEHAFDLSKIYPGLYGTADCVLYFSDTKTLQVIDYKHGAGVPVNVVDNDQLKYYGLGALTTLKLPCKTVQLTVVQPRCFHPEGLIRTFQLNAVDMLDFQADLIVAAKETEKEDAILKSGNHCRFCPASATCPKLHEEAKQLALLEFSETSVSYDKTALKNALDFIPRLEAWCKSVREFAYNEATSGREIEGYKLVEKRARRQWGNEETLEADLVKLGLKKKDIYEIPAIKSPAQIEKLFKGADKKKIEPLVVSISSGQTLVPDHDNRKQISGSRDPKNDFDVYEPKHA